MDGETDDGYGKARRSAGRCVSVLRKYGEGPIRSGDDRYGIGNL